MPYNIRTTYYQTYNIHIHYMYKSHSPPTQPNARKLPLLLYKKRKANDKNDINNILNPNTA